MTIDFLQDGARGQGRIRIEAQAVERSRELMRVATIAPPPSRQAPLRCDSFPGIVVPLGRPTS